MTVDTKPQANTPVVFVARPKGELGKQQLELRKPPILEVGENDVLARIIYRSVEAYRAVDPTLTPLSA